VKHLVFCISLLASVAVFGQGSVVLNDKPFEAQRKQDSSVYNQLVRQPLFNSLNKSEKELLYWVNVMRKDPLIFKDNYILPFLEQFPEAKSPESRSLVKRMSAMSALSQLVLSSVLVGTAGDHANYLADKKTISHTGRGGKGFVTRMTEAGVSGCAGENIFDGQDDGLVVLILLLMDTGVPGTGHREALLNPQFNTTGIGAARMDDRRVVFVQQFGCN
jgi:Cysteine-rich secretory protein family